MGIQNDEALFAAAIYEPSGAQYTRSIFGHHLPLMLMSYLGTLKAWIYTPVFRFWMPGAYSIRIPTLLLGTLSVWLFYLLLRRIGGLRAALIGSWLLATDAMFLLTICFDWGPVSLQHLLLIAGLLMLLLFYEERRSIHLAAGFFFFGLGMWDKAIFTWMLSGVAVAALAVFPREILRALTARRAAIASLAFGLGALPLVLFNASTKLETFRANTTYSASDLWGKSFLLRHTLDGCALFGWLVPEDQEVTNPQPARTALEHVSMRLDSAGGRQRESLMFYGFVAALLLSPLLWLRRKKTVASRRAVAFSVLAMTVAWLQMALTQGAGGAVHHAVLLWPFPQIVVAVVLADGSRFLGRLGKPALILVAVPLVASNVLVVNHYFVKMIRNGGALNWTDAIYPLSDSLRSVPMRRLFVIDWGIVDSLRLLNRGWLPLQMASDPLSKPQLDEADRQVVGEWLATPGGVFVGHTGGNEFFQGAKQHLDDIAGRLGYRKQMLRVIPDANGRPMFEVMRFAKSG